MAIQDAIKRVPKWAWIAGGGVALGVTAFRVVEGKTKTADTPAGDAEAGTDTSLPGSASSTGATSVLVPPVVIGGTTDTWDPSGAIDSVLNVMSGFVLGVPQIIRDAVQTGGDLTRSGVEAGTGAAAVGGDIAVQALTGGGAPTTPVINIVQPQPAAPAPDPNVLAYLQAQNAKYPLTNPSTGKRYRKIQAVKKLEGDCWNVEINDYQDGHQVVDHRISKAGKGVKC